MDDEFTEEEPKMEIEGRKDRIKRHFRDNRDRYVCFALGTGVAALALSGGDNRIKNSFIYKSIINNYMVVMPKGHYREAVAVRCIETGEEFASMARAARANNANVGDISRHLAGEKNHVRGLHFDKI